MSASIRPVVLVTGSARRLGREIALELAAHGFDVALHSHRTADECADTLVAAVEHGARAEAFAADLAIEADCDALLPAVVAVMGRVDAVVNNASRFEHDDIESFGHAALAAHWQVNTAAPLLLARALHAHLSGSGREGCVVNLLDQKLWNPNPDHLSYTLSKAALASATTLLAQALAPIVRVVGVAPGVTLPSGPMTDAEFTRAQGMTPLQRSSTPRDVARAVRFLIESPAITGTTLLVDGGQHLAMQPRDVLFLAQGAVR
ncbi:MAG: SDR family oxidoreductase [Methylibium sp.]|uniref:SDR family oxidoreductase n=1 Tax=Methylibium sp. TaxID=2067992 RepID=UPI0017FAB50E|nr:SDR family oxidoreductase [Methylibium sp.]MBA3596878.1 SDR family oxidoreductase [Methylibium sp.]